jgi:hypothetical protein
MNAETNRTAVAVLRGRWWNPEDEPFTRYSRNKKPNADPYLWADDLLNKVQHGIWKGKVKEFAIYIITNGVIAKEPLYKNAF